MQTSATKRAGLSSKPTAVVIDDSPASRRILRDLLEQAGFDVVAEGERGDQAIALYERHRPTVLTLDLVIPVIDGTTTAAAVLARHPQAAIVVCSSFRSREKILALRDLGVRHFILKPMVPATVFRIARSIIEGTEKVPSEVSPP